jgi:hypothetical protein
MVLTTNALVVALLVLMLVITVDAFLLRMKLRKVMRCKSGSIDDSIISLDKDVKSLGAFQKEAESYFQNVDKRLRRSVQGLETVRFNAFKGTGEGGNQSFATALVDEEGDGVVVSSMYSRDRVSVFSKPIAGFASTYELSEEEREALDRAKEKVSH